MTLDTGHLEGELVLTRGADSKMVKVGRKNIPLIFDPNEAYHTHKNDKDLYVDIETGGLNPWRDPVAVVSIYSPESEALSVLHVRGNMPESLCKLLSSPRVRLTGHNVIAFDGLFLANNGVDVFSPRWRCTLVRELVAIKTGRRDTRVNLETSVKRRIGVQLNKSIDHRTWMNPTLSAEQLAYAGGDVVHLPALVAEQGRAVEGSTQARAMAMEEALGPIILRMTMNGLPFSARARELYVGGLAEERARREDDLVQVFGPINLRSSLQLRQALAKEGVVLSSTAHDHLVDISTLGGRPGQLVDLILDFKKPDQRLKMYSDEWFAKHVTNGWTHPRVWQLGTNTGRMSNSDPNLQQIPKDNARKMFEAPEGWCIISADYSQIEIRVAAFYARDQMMFKALEQEDIHTYVAAIVFGRPASEITPEERKLAKAATFTLLFGGGAGLLYDYARHNGSTITPLQAQQFVKTFFDKFEGLAEMRRRAYAKAQNSKAVPIVLPSGLVRVLAGEDLKGTTILNTLVQGTAAAGLKYALLEADKAGLTKYIGATVHDEIVACVPIYEALDYAYELEQAMVKGMSNALPNTEIKVGVEIDRTWGGPRLLGPGQEDKSEAAFFTGMNQDSKSYRRRG